MAETEPEAGEGGVREILLSAAGKASTEQAGEDTDYDGAVTAGDAALLMRYHLGYRSTMPLPGGIEAPPTLTDTRLAVERIITGEFHADCDEAFNGLSEDPPKTYADLAGKRALFSTVADSLVDAVRGGVAAAMPTVSHDFSAAGRLLDPNITLPAPPDWKQVAALYYVYGEELIGAYADAVRVGWSLHGDVGVGLTLSFGAFETTAAYGDSKQAVAAKLAYVYLNTVYDMDGVEKAREPVAYSGAYLSTVIHPLPGSTIKNGWYDPRDKHTRYHMGTDILARGRTPILSATDGQVLYVGYLPIPGNYVIIRDPYGYEYHYYHMFEQSKYVKTGDVVKKGGVVGRVGNTGNSAANHLHLAIVTPQNTYVNPYELYLQAGASPIRIDG